MLTHYVLVTFKVVIRILANIIKRNSSAVVKHVDSGAKLLDSDQSFPAL